ncbi:MAG: hypothetical protein IKK99_07540 [Oscillospiraceae bacterium]|nr:hypothetical protein [Oscillospiraceae bacterium]
MKDEKLIAGREDILPTDEGYSRLEMLMQGNEEEHRRQDRNYMITFFVLALIVLFVIVHDKKKADNLKAETATHIDSYVRHTYGTQFDKFEVSEHIGEHYDYTTADRYGNYRLAYVSRSYIDPEWNRGFTIVADMGGNIVFDGYQTNYLKGSAVFSARDYEYYRAVNKVEATLCIRAGEKEYITILDDISLFGDFDAKGEVYFTHDSYLYSVYTGPVLYTDSLPSVNELAAEYGKLELEINLAKPTLQKYRDIILLCRSCMTDRDVAYACADIIINSKAELGKGDKISFTYSEIHSADFEQTLTGTLSEYIAE